MNKYCYIFPGQGSQYVGMGKDLYDNFPEAKEIYDRAEIILELPLKNLSFDGPENELRNTNNTQPAILVHSIICFEILKKKNIRPMLACGHSLGEYSALYSAGVIGFDSVLKLVKRRGQLMFAEGLKKPGAMAAIIGLADDDVIELCKKSSGVVVPANYNAPGQIVISGEPASVKSVCEQATAKGALKAIMLPVSGAFHSPLLLESAEDYKKYLQSFEFNTPNFPIIPNRSGEMTSEISKLRQALEEQLINPVLWTKTIENAVKAGYTDFIEVGPGRVLAALVKRIATNVKIMSIGKTEDFDKLD